MTQSDPGVARRATMWPALPAAAPMSLGGFRAPVPVGLPRLRPRPVPPRIALRVQPVHALQDGALLGAEVAGCSVGVWSPMDTAATQAGRGWPGSLVDLACLEARLWGALTGRPGMLAITVRIPASAACGPALVAGVERALDRSGLPAHLLELGIPARHLRDGDGATQRALSALRRLDVGLVLDGCGEWPGFGDQPSQPLLTRLRLHGHLVAHLDSSRDARQVLAGIVTAAHRRTMSVVATGLHTDMQRDILADLGCDAAQGRLFGPAMEANLFRAALACPWFS